MPDIRSHDWVRHHARRRPAQHAIVDTTTGAALTYAEMDRQVDSCAAFLARDHGVGAGDRVATLAHNCPEIFIIQAACARLRAIFLPLNWRLAEPELDYLVGDAAPKVIFADAEFDAVAASVCGRAAATAQVSIGPGTGFAAVLARHDRIEDLPAPTHSDPWLILYTSGTTGRPKGATLTHGQMALQMVGLGAEYGITHASVGLTYTPTFHASGLFMFADVILFFGGTTYLMTRFDAQECLNIMTNPDIGITHSLAIPTNLLMIRNLPDFEQADLTGMVIASGGSPVPTPLIRTYGEHGAKIPQVWGMTELCGVVTSLPPERSLDKAGSCGPPLMNMDIAIVDEEGNFETEPDTTGELVARGPMVMSGYWAYGDRNAEFFLPDGWFKTGDAARIDNEGYVTIVGRWKDMYISGGENVYPAEIEDVIYRLPEVDEVAVIGIPHELWGETGCACIVVKEGQVLSEEAVIEYCRGELARYKVPKSVVFRQELPHSANGKILKHVLKTEMGLDEIGAVGTAVSKS
ncbi:MAG: AMP-binding protein [Gammaproteobacteria bacterium]|nr:AMP-binding protein [Gammaproteobacteria bacterium]